MVDEWLLQAVSGLRQAGAKGRKRPKAEARRLGKQTIRNIRVETLGRNWIIFRRVKSRRRRGELWLVLPLQCYHFHKLVLMSLQ
jgi:hypothetical protein